MPLPPGLRRRRTTTVTTNGTTTTAVVIVSSPTTPKKKGFSLALAKITPGDSQSFPLPLLILGALAIILVVGGIAGMFWQRSHPRTTNRRRRRLPGRK